MCFAIRLFNGFECFDCDISLASEAINFLFIHCASILFSMANVFMVTCVVWWGVYDGECLLFACEKNVCCVMCDGRWAMGDV